MKINDVITEANIYRKLEKDPQKLKMLWVAMRHDGTLPIAAMGRLGPRPTPEQMGQTWSELLDTTLANAPTGDYSRDGKFDDWLTKLYIDQDFNWEDLVGQAVDALATWKALSNRGVLDDTDKDFNKFRSLRLLNAVVRKSIYQDDIKRWKESAMIEKMKAAREDLVLIDDERFFVSVPFNYGACYYLGHVGNGVIPTWCTGSSTGVRFAEQYIRDGLMIMVLDKANMNDINGKFQIHAATNQIKNSNQSENSDELFATLFPGLMKRIVAAVSKNARQLEDLSQNTNKKTYDIPFEIGNLKAKFPLSWQSTNPEDEEKLGGDDEDDAEEKPTTKKKGKSTEPVDAAPVAEPEAPAEPVAGDANDGPGEYELIRGGTRVVRNFASIEDARQQLLARNPTLDIDTVTIRKIN
jgi:hypothetical protein